MPSKEGRFENGHSASKAMSKRSNESISARGLIAIVQRSILEALKIYGEGAITRVRRRKYDFGGVAVIFKLISRSRR